jgi:hypothetical protein
MCAYLLRTVLCSATQYNSRVGLRATSDEVPRGEQQARISPDSGYLSFHETGMPEMVVGPDVCRSGHAMA